MPQWRVARSLDVLLGQLNTRFPARSKASDGSVGDLAHSARKSDHNPDRQGIVRARDYTHDPRVGLDIARLAKELQASRDPRISYIIANRQIMSGAWGPAPWQWKPYTGANPHTKHLHLSVVGTVAGDDTTPWRLPMLGATPTVSVTASRPTLRKGSTGAAVRQLQTLLGITADGTFGPATDSAVRKIQRTYGLPVDGIVGPRTWAALDLEGDMPQPADLWNYRIDDPHEPGKPKPTAVMLGWALTHAALARDEVIKQGEAHTREVGALRAEFTAKLDAILAALPKAQP